MCSAAIRMGTGSSPIYWEYGHGPGRNWFEPDLRLRKYVEGYLSCIDLLQE